MNKKGMIGENISNWILWIIFIIIAMGAVAYLVNSLLN